MSSRRFLERLRGEGGGILSIDLSIDIETSFSSVTGLRETDCPKNNIGSPSVQGRNARCCQLGRIALCWERGQMARGGGIR